MMFLRNTILVLSAGAFAGCASVNPNPAFQDLANTVHARTGKRVHWVRGTPEDAEAESAVQSLLRRPLTVDIAVQIALLNNHNLQATYEELGIAQADLVEAGLLKNPVFSFQRRFPGQAMEMDVLKEFIDVLLLPLRKRIAAAQFDAEKLRIGHEILKLTAEVSAAFYQHQGDQQILDMRRTVEKATEQSAEAALKLHEAGNTKTLDLANEQALHVQAKLDLAKSQSEAVESREKLNNLMGAWGAQTSWTVAPRLAELPGHEVSSSGLETRAIAQRLDLAAAKQELLVQARSLGLARFDAIGQQLEIGSHYERETDGTLSIGPSLDVPVPIFNQGQPAMARGRSKIRQAQQRYLAMAVQVRSEVRSARDRMLLARQRAEYFKSTALPLRRRIIDETQLEYNAMQVGVFQLLQAKQEEVKAGGEYIEALRDYWTARADLEKAVGGSLTGAPIVQATLSKETTHQH